MGINTAAISGNLTRDIECRTSRGGTTIGRMGVAVNERRKNASGEWEDYANYIDVVLFGRRAEALEKYLVKGAKVCVKGRLHWSSWQADDGSRRSKVEVVADDIDLMSRAEGTGKPRRAASAPAAFDDEDIPF